MLVLFLPEELYTGLARFDEEGVDVYDRNSVGICIVDGVGGTARRAVVIGDAEICAVDELTVALVHTTARIMGLGVGVGVALGEHLAVDRPILLAPFVCLIGTGQAEVKRHVGIALLFENDYVHCGEAVKAPRAARTEGGDSPSISLAMMGRSTSLRYGRCFLFISRCPVKQQIFSFIAI